MKCKLLSLKNISQQKSQRLNNPVIRITEAFVFYETLRVWCIMKKGKY